MDHDPLRRGFAEFVGTFALIFIGAGSILTLTTVFAPGISGPQDQGIYGGLTLVAIALAHGLVIAVMVSAVGHISGGHLPLQRRCSCAGFTPSTSASSRTSAPRGSAAASIRGREW